MTVTTFHHAKTGQEFYRIFRGGRYLCYRKTTKDKAVIIGCDGNERNKDKIIGNIESFLGYEKIEIINQ
jgi:hypothetical protein